MWAEELSHFFEHSDSRSEFLKTMYSCFRPQIESFSTTARWCVQPARTNVGRSSDTKSSSKRRWVLGATPKISLTSYEFVMFLDILECSKMIFDGSDHFLTSKQSLFAFAHVKHALNKHELWSIQSNWPSRELVRKVISGRPKIMYRGISMPREP